MSSTKKTVICSGYQRVCLNGRSESYFLFLGTGAHPMRRWDTKVLSPSCLLCSCFLAHGGEPCPQAGQRRLNQEIVLCECSCSAIAEEDSWLNYLSLGSPLEKKYREKRCALSLGFDLAFINDSKNLHGSMQLFYYCC